MTFKVGDKVYHRFLQQTGTVTATGMGHSGDAYSTVVMFGCDEIEVTTACLEPVVTMCFSFNTEIEIESIRKIALEQEKPPIKRKGSV